MKLFILAGLEHTNLAEKVSQILQEYDYEVINPRIIQDYERHRVELGMFDDNHGWIKRDITLMLRADGVAIPDEINNGIDLTRYEANLLTLTLRFPWIMKIATVSQWIKEVGVEDGN